MKKYQGQTVLTIEDAVPCRNGCGAEPVLWRRGARRAVVCPRCGSFGRKFDEGSLTFTVDAAVRSWNSGTRLYVDLCDEKRAKRAAK